MCPLYEYSCKNEKCNHKFEDIRKFDEDNPVCPKCGKEVKKLISAGKFEIYGEGVYKEGMS